jgi:hypothetical protein
LIFVVWPLTYATLKWSQDNCIGNGWHCYAIVSFALAKIINPQYLIPQLNLLDSASSITANLVCSRLTCGWSSKNVKYSKPFEVFTNGQTFILWKLLIVNCDIHHYLKHIVLFKKTQGSFLPLQLIHNTQLNIHY